MFGTEKKNAYKKLKNYPNCKRHAMLLYQFYINISLSEVLVNKANFRHLNLKMQVDFKMHEINSIKVGSKIRQFSKVFKIRNLLIAIVESILQCVSYNRYRMSAFLYKIITLF